jgi:hypothetical protein
MQEHEGSISTPNRSQNRIADREAYDTARVKYAAEYEALLADHQPLAAVLSKYTKAQEQIEATTSKTLEESASYNSRLQSIDSDRIFLRKEIENLLSVRERSVLTGKLDHRLRRAPIGTWIAERVLFPADFMGKQLQAVESAFAVSVDRQREAAENSDNTLRAVREQEATLRAEIYATEAEWVISGNMERAVLYAIDHPEHKADLFARYLAVNPTPGLSPKLHQLFDKYIPERLRLPEVVKREKPEAPKPAAKARVANPKVNPLIDSAEQTFDYEAYFSDIQEQKASNETLKNTPTFHMRHGPNSEPIPVTSADQIDILPSYIKVEKVWDILAWVQENHQADRATSNSRYGRFAKSGRYPKWREIGISGKDRLLVRIWGGEIEFAYGDHNSLWGHRGK